MERRCSLFVWAFLTFLGGCSLSGPLTGSSLDYNQALEVVTDNMLATNVLLARDRAPLHFTDLSQIRGSLQLQAQVQATEPFGSEYTSTSRSRAMLTGLLAGASNPTFDIVPLNTRNFTTGITEPLDIKTFMYYMNQEYTVYQETITNLLFAKIAIVWGDGTSFNECEFINRPQLAPLPSQEKCNEKARNLLGLNKNDIHFEDMVTRLMNLDYVRKNPSDLGPSINISGRDLLRGAGAFVGSNLSIKEQHLGSGEGRYHISRDNKEGVLCSALVPPGEKKVSWHVIRFATLGDPVDRSPSEDPTYACTGQHSFHKTEASAPQVYLYIRSVEAVFQYLGSMLNYPNNVRAIPFYIDKVRPKNPRFSVYYRGSRYYISEDYSPCKSHSEGNAEVAPTSSFQNPQCSGGKTDFDARSSRGDQTLFVLSILNQLLNLHKTASEIPTTPAVQAVP